MNHDVIPTITCSLWLNCLQGPLLFSWSWVSDLHLKIQALSFVEFYILGHCFAFCTLARVTFVVFQFSIASPVSFCFLWSPHICFLFVTSCFILVVFCLLCFVLIIQFLLVLLPRFSSPVHYFPQLCSLPLICGLWLSPNRKIKACF